MIIDRQNLQIGLVVGLTMFISIIIAKVFGGLIPLVADRLNIDPAIMSSSIITTLVDAVALNNLLFNSCPSTTVIRRCKMEGKNYSRERIKFEEQDI